MKKLLFTLLCLGLWVPSMYAELPTYTRVYAVYNGEDAFDYSINVYQEPDTTSAVVQQLGAAFSGLAPAILLERAYTWSKIQMGDVVGYVECNKIDFQTWYYAEGIRVVLTAKDQTPIYADDPSGESEMIVVDYVAKNTIMTDDLILRDGYYVLETAHDNLYLKKSDVQVVYRIHLPQ